MSYWGERSRALLLVELLCTSEARRRAAQADAWEQLLVLGWARRTRRHGVLALESAAEQRVEETLQRAWPEWRHVAERLADHELPPCPSGFAQLERQDRADAARGLELPARMNRRTAAATVGLHSKARLGPFDRVVLEDVDLTDDGLVRLRPSAGLQVRYGDTVHDARALASVLGELVVVDRALRDGTRLVGTPPRAVLTVENLGAFQDVVVPDDVLVAHVPGWNTRATKDLLRDWETVPLLHFGDLDPNGVAILEHLRLWRPSVRWFVPSFWEEFQDAKGLTKEWPEMALPDNAPAWVRRLPERRMWLEQESVVVDSRCTSALEAAIRDALLDSTSLPKASGATETVREQK